jgi:calcineurin-like phosphoesterase family protein
MKANTWFISDLHIGHGPDKGTGSGVIKYSNRPFESLDQMHEAIIANFNKVVGPNDTVWFLGDLFFCDYQKAEAFMNRLNGKRWLLVRGNHDRFSDIQYSSLGFESVVEEVKIKVFGRYLRLSHFPRRPSWWQQLFRLHRKSLKYMDRRPPSDGLWLLHGHTHSKEKINYRTRSLHVGCDSWNFTPVSLREIESLIAKAELI